MYQLCTRDEYGQTSILPLPKDVVAEGVQAIVNHAKALVSDENLSNALTLTEQKRDFTAVLPVLVVDNETVSNVVYAGRNGRAEEMVLDIDNKDSTDQPFEGSGLDVVFYIGTEIVDRKNDITNDHFAETPKLDILRGFDSNILEGKTFYYIKKI